MPPSYDQLYHESPCAGPMRHSTGPEGRAATPPLPYVDRETYRQVWTTTIGGQRDKIGTQSTPHDRVQCPDTDARLHTCDTTPHLGQGQVFLFAHIPTGATEPTATAAACGTKPPMDGTMRSAPLPQPPADGHNVDAGRQATGAGWLLLLRATRPPVWQPLQPRVRKHQVLLLRVLGTAVSDKKQAGGPDHEMGWRKAGRACKRQPPQHVRWHRPPLTMGRVWTV